MKRKYMSAFLCIALIALTGLSQIVYAGERSREEKIQLYEALHGDEAEPENDEVQPAQTGIPYAPVGEDAAFAEDIDLLKACQGTYIQEANQAKSGKVYKAEVEIKVEDNVPTCIIDYTNYMGYLEEATVLQNGTEEYPFVTRPIGRGVGSGGQEFFIEFSPEKMHIVWGEGSCEYNLTKSQGAADELESRVEPYEESEAYRKLVAKVDELFNGFVHKTTYNDENKTVTICVVINDVQKANFLSDSKNYDELWIPYLKNLVSLTEQLQTAITLAVRDGIYDITEGHCKIQIVDHLADTDEYNPQEIRTIVKDGGIEYDALTTEFLQAGAKDTPSDSSGDAFSVDGSTFSSGAGDFSGDFGGSVSSGERNALKRAKDYLEYSAFSYQSLKEQLEFEGYSSSEAIYAVDHCGADWNEQAYKRAKQYLDYSAFSYDGLIDQLLFEGFTQAQAEHGAGRAY